MGLPDHPDSSPLLVAQLDIQRPKRHKPDPVLGIDLVCHEAVLPTNAAAAQSPWAAPLDMRPCPVELKSMKVVDGGHTAYAGFRPQLGPGFVFVAPALLDSALQGAVQQVLIPLVQAFDASN